MCATSTWMRGWSASRRPGIAPEAGRFESSSHWWDSDDSGRANQAEELIGQLKRRLLRAGRRFARELRERVAEIDAGEPEDIHECGRQRAAVVEERVERVGDVALIDAKGAGGRARSARRVRHAERGQGAERGSEIEVHVGRGVAQRRDEAGRQVGGGESVERAAASARGRKDGIGARHVAARRKRRLHRAAEARRAGDIGAVRIGRGDLDEVARGRSHHQIAVHRDRADGVAGRERAAIDDRVADTVSEPPLIVSAGAEQLKQSVRPPMVPILPPKLAPVSVSEAALSSSSEPAPENLPENVVAPLRTMLRRGDEWEGPPVTVPPPASDAISAKPPLPTVRAAPALTVKPGSSEGLLMMLLVMVKVAPF